MLKPGDTIDRYVIEATLGEGGMGRVYRALDPRLGRRVALKVILTTGATEGSRADAAARMEREARAAAAFNHPNVVAIYDVGEVDGAPYIVMELVSGTTLRPYIGDAHVSDAKKRAWLLDVARGLGAAHRAGLVHRDIKPDNVMITEAGVVKILDFGIARRTAAVAVDATGPTAAANLPSITADGVMLGTPLYMAPEQLHGQALDGRADQFAWGVMAWELLVGALPWKTASGVHFVAALLTHTVPPLSDAKPEIDPRLSDAVARAVAKHKEDRFESMEALLAAVEDEREPPIVVRSNPIAAPAPTTAQAVASLPATAPPARLRRRRPWLAGAFVVASVGVAALFFATRRTTVAQVPSPPTTSATPTRVGCTTNAGCIQAHDGHDFLCRKDDGACVALETDKCRVFAEPGDVTNDDTIWIGCLTPDEDQSWRELTTPLDLARREIAEAGSLPPRSGQIRRRPLALVACRAAIDDLVAANHLADLRVPVVVGSVRSVASIASVFIPKDIAVITINADTTLTHVQAPEARPRLVWRAYVTLAGWGEGLSSVASRILAGSLVLSSAPADPRVALVTANTSRGTQFSDTFVSAIRIDGRSGVRANEAVLNIVADATSREPSHADTLRLVKFAPAVIALSIDPPASWLAAVESAWPAAKPKPIYITSGFPRSLVPFIVATPAARRRFLALDWPADTDENIKFAMRYNARYGPELTVTPGTAPSVDYDPFYVAALAIVAAGDRPLTGRVVADGIARLVPPGPTIPVGPVRLFDAFDLLGRGDRIDLDGAGSPLDFDLETGESTARIAVYCLKIVGNGVDAVESGVVYDTSTKAITGLLRCPR